MGIQDFQKWIQRQFWTYQDAENAYHLLQKHYCVIDITNLCKPNKYVSIKLPATIVKIISASNLDPSPLLQIYLQNLLYKIEHNLISVADFQITSRFSNKRSFSFVISHELYKKLKEYHISINTTVFNFLQISLRSLLFEL